MAVIGWSILAVAIIFSIDLQEKMHGRELSESGKATACLMFIGCVTMMVVLSFRQ